MAVSDYLTSDDYMQILLTLFYKSIEFLSSFTNDSSNDIISLCICFIHFSFKHQIWTYWHLHKAKPQVITGSTALPPMSLAKVCTATKREKEDESLESTISLHLAIPLLSTTPFLLAVLQKQLYYGLKKNIRYHSFDVSLNRHYKILLSISFMEFVFHF